ncbi:MAG: hypothetical protein ABIP48_18045 [Planctomycetota bacterium]
MQEFIVRFTDGASVCVKASNYYQAIAKAKRYFRGKQFASIERARCQRA